MFNCPLHNVTSYKSRMFNLSALETLLPCYFKFSMPSNLRRTLIEDAPHFQKGILRGGGNFQAHTFYCPSNLLLFQRGHLFFGRNEVVGGFGERNIIPRI